MQLTPLMNDFIAHFGEMGSHWGINRTIGQIYALLYVSPKPLSADVIAKTLSFSRSNVSMGIKELDSWRLLKTKHYPGDRKDYFTVPDDIWLIIRTLFEERKKREVDPTLTMLRSALLDAEAGNQEEAQTLERLKEMHDVIELFDSWYADMEKLDTKKLLRYLTLGSKLIKFLDAAEKLTFKKSNE
ncbi:MAG: GbsR/MarR family transcriptional regulator [Pseudomonadota bacterium]